MDVWRLHLCSLLSLHAAFSAEVTVKHTELQPCDQHVCVTDIRDCGPRPPSSAQETLSMSCYYQKSARSLTCAWSPDSDGLTDASLIFSSENIIIKCQSILHSSARLNVTARIINYRTGTETWSQPHTVDFFKAVKPLPPSLSVLGSTEDSLTVGWTNRPSGGCRLRYRVSGSQTWIQVADSVLDQEPTHVIRDLQPYTVYTAAASCSRASGIWSDWSSDVSGRTKDRAPSRPPQVCYRAERAGPGGALRLHLVWKTSDPVQDGARIHGYQVRYEPAGRIENVTEATALLVVQEGNCSVSVSAFNTAGCGPAAHLTIDAQRIHTLPSVRGLWVSSFYPGNDSFLVQWEASTLPVSHFVVQWRSEMNSSTLRWSGVTTSITSAVIQDVDPDESYLISVFPVHQQQCGSPQSLSASLQHGALMEAVSLNIVRVTKTTVTVLCAWQRTRGPIRVSQYRVMLRRHSDRHGGPALTLYPDQSQLTFFNLTPNTQYSLFLLADNISRSIVPVVTSFDEVPVIATATPLVLLALTVSIISILSRTVYKSYFFPHISSPRVSTTGRWLMDPNIQKCAERTNILTVEDFQGTDVLWKKSLITMDPKRPSEHGDTTPPLISRFFVQLDSEYVSEQQEVSLPEKEERPDAAPLPHRDEERQQGDVPQVFNHTETEARCVGQVTCEAEYVVHSFLDERDAEAEQTRLICEPGYLPNTELSCTNELPEH